VEGFEAVVKVAMEAENLIVTGNLKFPVARRVKKKSREETQEHGYEVDLVGANREKLVLASVKSFFGSGGVGRQGFKGLADESKRTNYGLYHLFNELDVQQGVIQQAAQRFGYLESQVELRLYVGKFRQVDKASIIQHLGQPRPGFLPVTVFDLEQIVVELLGVLDKRTYFNDPVVVTLKALKHARKLNLRQSEDQHQKSTDD
jgi:hypothetical protein